MRIVVDTDVASNLLKGSLPPNFRGFLAPHEAAITFVTVGELTKWVYLRDLGARRRGAIEAFLATRSEIPGGADVATWTVTSHGEDGSLTVNGRTGTRSLPAAYVDRCVELAYATTVYGAQGETVHTAYLLVGEHTGASSAYVAMTRGRDHNITHLVAEDVERWAEATTSTTGDPAPTQYRPGGSQPDAPRQPGGLPVTKSSNEPRHRHLSRSKMAIAPAVVNFRRREAGRRRRASTERAREREAAGIRAAAARGEGSRSDIAGRPG